MAEAQLRVFLEKVRQLNAFVALSEADPRLRQELCDCEHHDEVVALARRCGFEIGRRWGEPPPPEIPPGCGADPAGTSRLPGTGAGERAIPRQGPDGLRKAPLRTAPGSGGDASTARPRPRSGPLDSAEAEGAAGSARGTEGAADHGAETGTPATVAPPPGDGAPVAARAKANREGGWGHGGGGQAPVASGDPILSLRHGSCPPPGEEVIQVLLDTPSLRLERIHSCAAESPEGFWYDQREDEWVTLLQGSACLQFADEREERRLQAGDSLLIRAGRRHRVSATDPAPGTVWLALFWRHS
jgi:nif11/cupin domain protein